MITIDRVSTPILTAIGEQVLAIAEDNVTGLSMSHPPVNHPLYSVYKLVLLTELRAYLSRRAPSQFELVTASEEGEVIGFTLCGLSDSASPECGIYYIAVAKQFRGKGVMSLMVRDILAHYSEVSLACSISLVPKYERYGFIARGVRDHHIIMAVGNPMEVTPVLDSKEIMQQPNIVDEHLAACQRSSEREIGRANKAQKTFFKTESVKAKAFLQQRLRQQA